MHDLDLGVLIVRVWLGVIMFAHGWNHFFGGGRLPGAGRWFESLGIKPGIFHAWLTALTEVATGVMLAAGLLTPLACAGTIGVLAVAAIVVHRKNGFFILKEGYEYAVLIILTCAAIGVLGPGRWSVDHAIGLHDVHGGGGLGLSFGLGLGAAVGLLAVFWRPPKPATS